MAYKYSLLYLFLSFMLISCQANSEKEISHEEAVKSKAESIVNKAIEKAGTLEKWNRINSIAYTKKSRLLLENGEIESEVTQRHEYHLGSNKQFSITWTEKEDEYLIRQNDSVSQKFKNGILIEEGEKVEFTVNSAFYVLGMPFKLLDPGAVLEYKGKRSFDDSDPVDVVNARYNPEQNENHSTQDEWWYHFDESGAFCSSLVYHHPTYALIENLSVIETEGMIFPGIRKSYRCDNNGKKAFLRAEFWYTDYSISFSEE